MSKPKINIEELAKDMDKVFDIIENLDLNTLSNKSTKSEIEKIHKLQEELENKYKDNLDSKK
tara:strand:- start:481 stop:666 length:186 start_codon:yes stop_codon:yes gene_type:complete